MRRHPIVYKRMRYYRLFKILPYIHFGLGRIVVEARKASDNGSVSRRRRLVTIFTITLL